MVTLLLIYYIEANQREKKSTQRTHQFESRQIMTFPESKRANLSKVLLRSCFKDSLRCVYSSEFLIGYYLGPGFLVILKALS